MRKIGLLVVLITMVMFSCVDDKESATVEQMRTAKTAWLQAQAEMIKAQGEAQKILAETEKLKAENDAKNEAARIEIEKLKAQAEAAKTEAEAEQIRAEIERINQEVEQARLEFEYQQRLNELEYQVAEAKAAYKLQEFQNKLNQAIIDGKLNSGLIEVYNQYTSALNKLRGAELKVSQKQQEIATKEKTINSGYDGYVKGLQTEIATAQKNIEEAKAALETWMENNTDVTKDEASKKVEELNAQKEALDKKYSDLTLKLIDLQADQSKLLAALDAAKKNQSNANNAKNKAGEELEKATQAYEDAENGLNSAKQDIINEFPEFEYGVTTNIEKKQAELEKATAETAKTLAEAKVALEKAKTSIPELFATKENAEKAVEPIQKEAERLTKELAEATEEKAVCEGKQAALKEKMETEKGVYDNHLAEVKRLTELLKDESLSADEIAGYQRELKIAEELAAETKITYDAAKKAHDDNEAALKEAKDSIEELNKEIEKNAKTLAEAVVAMEKAEKTYNDTMEAVKEGGELQNKIAIAESNANNAEEAEANFKERLEAANKTLTDFLADKEKAEKAFATAEETLEASVKAVEDAEKAIEDSEYSAIKKERENIESEKAVYDALITKYEELINDGSLTEYKESIEAKIKECNENIATYTETIEENQALIKEFEAAEEAEKDEIVNRGHETLRNEIAILEQEIKNLQEIIVYNQAEVDRLKGVIDSLEEAE
ncbi:hypothetical protein [Butyricimonas hominis]|uniref:Uncharacterized protein n=2 Tax=Butyricimonas TaxID=574697 RepID=A0ABR7D1K1_9BACT|nr:hypothetical protein [Butyricimonas hominis]MBC5621823.1 hypothetical protein [Butyricimonas hominis]